MAAFAIGVGHKPVTRHWLEWARSGILKSGNEKHARLMKLFSRFFVVAIGLFLTLSPQAHAGQGLEFTKRVQDGLIAAEPIRGPGVDRELFNGKPVLVVFFASW